MPVSPSILPHRQHPVWLTSTVSTNASQSQKCHTSRTSRVWSLKARAPQPCRFLVSRPPCNNCQPLHSILHRRFSGNIIPLITHMDVRAALSPLADRQTCVRCKCISPIARPPAEPESKWPSAAGHARNLKLARGNEWPTGCRLRHICTTRKAPLPGRD
jgi:hypothetical protein